MGLWVDTGACGKKVGARKVGKREKRGSVGVRKVGGCVEGLKVCGREKSWCRKDARKVGRREEKIAKVWA